MACGGIDPRLAFCGDRISSNFLFLTHNFSSRYAIKPIKGSKDLDGSLDSKKGLLGWRPGSGKLGHKDETCPHYDIIQRKP